MAEAKGQGAHPWVQPIFVSKAGLHQPTVELAARASLAVRFHGGVTEAIEEDFEQWLSGPFTKTVRRGSLDQLRKVVAWAEEQGSPYVLYSEGDSAALALPPLRYEAMPKVMSRLQVAGTDLPWSETFTPAGTTPYVEVLETLTTGKACAQAAHAYWGWHLAHGVGADLLPEIGFGDAELLEVLAMRAGSVVVRDNGLTEVGPQTLTAVVAA